MQKKWILAANAADHADRFAKIHLRMARRMRQLHEGLATSRPRDPHIILHHRIAAAEPMLVAQPLEYPLRRMPLLRRQQRAELRLRHRLRPRIPGGNENRHIFNTVSRLSPNIRAASRRLFPSTKTKCRTAA